AWAVSTSRPATIVKKPTARAYRRRICHGRDLSDPAGGLHLPTRTGCLWMRWYLPQAGLRGEWRLLSGGPRALTWVTRRGPSTTSNSFKLEAGVGYFFD